MKGIFIINLEYIQLITNLHLWSGISGESKLHLVNWAKGL